MKKIVYIVILITQAQSLAQTQPFTLPHYEPFEETTYKPGHINDGKEWQEQEYDTSRIGLVNFHNFYSKSVKLEIKDGDFTGLDSTDGRERSEIALWRYWHETKNNHTFYYSWDLYIPDQNFTTETQDDFYYFIMQWHEGPDVNFFDCPSSFPPMQLNLVYEPNAADNFRDLRLNYGTHYGWCGNGGDVCNDDPNSKGNNHYYIYDGIKLNTWNKIVTKIKWSYEWDKAQMSMWINDMPITKSQMMPPAFPCEITDVLKVGNELSLPYSFSGVPLLYGYTDIFGNEIYDDNGLKFGSYRKNYSSDNELYVDNFRITKEYPPSKYKTFIIDQNCYNTSGGCNKGSSCILNLDVEDDYNITAYEIEPSESYKFKIMDGSSTYYAYSVSSSFNLLNENWARADKTYQIYAKARNNIIQGIPTNGFNYSKSCTVITPASTKLKTEFCSTNSNNPYVVPNTQYSDGIVPIYKLPGATQYRLKFQNVNDINDVFWTDTSLNENTINVFDQYQLKENTTYEVKIRAQRYENNNDVYDSLPYGSSCYLRINEIPVLTQLSIPYCNKIFNSSIISCDPVETATSYVFEFTNQSGYIQYGGSVNTTFNLLNQYWFQSGEIYDVRVRAKSNNGVNGFQYGDSCTIQSYINTTNKKSDNIVEAPRIHPNPIKNTIYVSGVTLNFSFNIYEITGFSLLKGKVIDGKIVAENLQKGVYFLKINDNSNTFIYKIIKE